jgi:hypothetical protein
VSGRAVRRAKRILGLRREAFDKLKPEDRMGMNRPGSLNPHKQGGGYIKKKGKK